MKIYSWNVNGLRAVLRKNALQDFLATEKPDILCLQEIKAKPAQVGYDFPGYKIVWNPAERPGYSGTATLFSESSMDLAKEKINLSDVCQSATFSIGEVSPENNIAVFEGRILITDCEKFYLVNVYVPNSKPDLSRLRFREENWDPDFLKSLKELEKTKPVVVCGDFNAAHQEIDLARPKANHLHAGFTDQERQGITNLLHAGFIDTFRAEHPDVERYTWWSHWGKARENNVGWRIDYFFISESLKQNLKSAEIYEHYFGSDHCPIGIELEF